MDSIKKLENTIRRIKNEFGYEDIIEAEKEIKLKGKKIDGFTWFILRVIESFDCCLEELTKKDKEWEEYISFLQKDIKIGGTD